MSLFPFRQISEFPTGAALLNERTAVYDEKVYRSFGGVCIAESLKRARMMQRRANTSTRVGIAVWYTLHTGKCL